VFRNCRYGVQISVGVHDNRPVSFGDRHEEPFDQSSPRLAVQLNFLFDFRFTFRYIGDRHQLSGLRGKEYTQVQVSCRYLHE